MISPPQGAPPAVGTQQSGAPVQQSVLPASHVFAVVFSILALLVTAGAVALATIGGQQYSTPQDAAPAGWSQVYDASLTSSDSEWDTTQGCQFNSDGLYAPSDAVCNFLPSTNQDLVSQGFLLRVTVGPAADVPDALQPAIVLGSHVSIALSQMGDYEICDPVGCPSDELIKDIKGTTINWHGDPYVANTITVKYNAQVGQLTLYLNDIQIASAALTIQPGDKIALAAPDGAEALYTHASLYTAGG
jgi:hypothetical protein